VDVSEGHGGRSAGRHLQRGAGSRTRDSLDVPRHAAPPSALLSAPLGATSRGHGSDP
jgi:hypothetical protein